MYTLKFEVSEEMVADLISTLKGSATDRLSLQSYYNARAVALSILATTDEIASHPLKVAMVEKLAGHKRDFEEMYRKHKDLVHGEESAALYKKIVRYVDLPPMEEFDPNNYTITSLLEENPEVFFHVIHEV